MAAYTYDDLARDIAQMSPEERKQQVQFVCPHHDSIGRAVSDVRGIHATDEDEEDELGEVTPGGTLYLHT